MSLEFGEHPLLLFFPLCVSVTGRDDTNESRKLQFGFCQKQIFFLLIEMKNYGSLERAMLNLHPHITHLYVLPPDSGLVPVCPTAQGCSQGWSD